MEFMRMRGKLEGDGVEKFNTDVRNFNSDMAIRGGTESEDQEK